MTTNLTTNTNPSKTNNGCVTCSTDLLLCPKCAVDQICFTSVRNCTTCPTTSCISNLNVTLINRDTTQPLQKEGVSVNLLVAVGSIISLIVAIILVIVAKRSLRKSKLKYNETINEKVNRSSNLAPYKDVTVTATKEKSKDKTRSSCFKNKKKSNGANRTSTSFSMLNFNCSEEDYKELINTDKLTFQQIIQIDPKLIYKLNKYENLYGTSESNRDGSNIDVSGIMNVDTNIDILRGNKYEVENKYINLQNNPIIKTPPQASTPKPLSIQNSNFAVPSDNPNNNKFLKPKDLKKRSYYVASPTKLHFDILHYEPEFHDKLQDISALTIDPNCIDPFEDNDLSFSLDMGLGLEGYNSMGMIGTGDGDSLIRSSPFFEGESEDKFDLNIS